MPGRPSARHNLNYWTFGDFLGIGAGAHAKLSDPAGHIVRTWKTRCPGLPGQEQALPGRRAGADAGELPFEFLMNVLRLTDGVQAELFTTRTGPLSGSPKHAAKPRLAACWTPTRHAWWRPGKASCSSTTCCNTSCPEG